VLVKRSGILSCRILPKPKVSVSCSNLGNLLELPYLQTLDSESLRAVRAHIAGGGFPVWFEW